MSSVNNSYGNYSYDYKQVHKALDKNKDGYVNLAEIQAYQQRLASNNSTSAKKAKTFLSDLLANYDKVNGLHNSATRGVRPRNTEDERNRQEASKQDTLLGLSISDFSYLASGSSSQNRIEKLDFSTAKPWGGYPPP